MKNSHDVFKNSLKIDFIKNELVTLKNHILNPVFIMKN